MDENIYDMDFSKINNEKKKKGLPRLFSPVFVCVSNCSI